VRREVTPANSDLGSRYEIQRISGNGGAWLALCDFKADGGVVR